MESHTKLTVPCINLIKNGFNILCLTDTIKWMVIVTFDGYTCFNNIKIETSDMCECITDKYLNSIFVPLEFKIYNIY